jgi:hypothetical protein
MEAALPHFKPGAEIVAAASEQAYEPSRQRIDKGRNDELREVIGERRADMVMISWPNSHPSMFNWPTHHEHS